MKKRRLPSNLIFFFFNDTATTEIYTLSLHDALPIYNSDAKLAEAKNLIGSSYVVSERAPQEKRDRKSTRLNSSHSQISYAVFCLKKKKNIRQSRMNTYECIST